MLGGGECQSLDGATDTMLVLYQGTILILYWGRYMYYIYWCYTGVGIYMYYIYWCYILALLNITLNLHINELIAIM